MDDNLRDSHADSKSGKHHDSDNSRQSAPQASAPQASDAHEWEHIASQFCAGDIDAFRHIVETWENQAVRFARGLVHDGTAAEDMVQEAFLRAWQKKSTLRNSARLRPWFYRILNNICRDHLRRASTLSRLGLVETWQPSPAAEKATTPHSLHPNAWSSTAPKEPSEAADPRPGPTEHLLAKEERDNLGRALSRLSARDQTLLGLRYGAELPIAEIAQALRMRPNTVLSRIHRALKKLRLDLELSDEEQARWDPAPPRLGQAENHRIARAPPKPPQPHRSEHED